MASFCPSTACSGDEGCFQVNRVKDASIVQLSCRASMNATSCSDASVEAAQRRRANLTPQRRVCAKENNQQRLKNPIWTIL